MGITGIHYCYFITWTVKDLFVEKNKFNVELWKNVKTNCEFFSKSCLPSTFSA